MTGWVRWASYTQAGSRAEISYGHRMVAARPANAVLINASCWAQAGYSAPVRPAQMGSPMIRTRRPAWALANAISTVGMIAPGLRPATVMSRHATRSASAPRAPRSDARLAVGTAAAT